jgi:hypothetical protein
MIEPRHRRIDSFHGGALSGAEAISNLILSYQPAVGRPLRMNLVIGDFRVRSRRQAASR